MILRNTIKVKVCANRVFKVLLSCGHVKTLRHRASINTSKQHQCIDCEDRGLAAGGSWFPEPGDRIKVLTEHGVVVTVNVPNLLAVVKVDEDFSTRPEGRLRTVNVKSMRHVDDVAVDLELKQRVVARTRVCTINKAGRRKPFMFVAPGSTGTVLRIEGSGRKRHHIIRWDNTEFLSSVMRSFTSRKFRKVQEMHEK